MIPVKLQGTIFNQRLLSLCILVGAASKKRGSFVKGLCKIATITRNAVFGLKCTTNRLAAGLCPDSGRGEKIGGELYRVFTRSS